MPSFLDKLIDFGNTDSTSSEKRKWIKLSNISALLSLLGFFAHGLVFAFVGTYHLASLAFLLGFAQLGLLFLNKQKIYQPNWLGYQFINGFFIFYFSTVMGDQAPVYWFYLIVLKTSFVYSYGKRYRWVKWGLIAFLGSLVYADLGLNIRPFGTYLIPPQYHDFFVIFEPACCYALLLLFIYYFVSQTHITSKELSRQAKKLASKNVELERLNNVLDKLVYYAWHDLRAPIASAMGLINLAKDETNLEVIQQYLNLQDKSLKKLDKLIRGLEKTR